MADTTNTTENETVKTAGQTQTNADTGSDMYARGANPFPFLTGRKVIYTDHTDVNAGNILDIVGNTLALHEINREQMVYLRRYEKGQQPIFYRIKKVRPEINIKTCINYAKQVVDFKVGYEFSAPVTFVQRAKNDFRKADPNQDDKRVADLNEMLFEQGKPAKDIELATDFKTTGLGYMAALPKKQEAEDEIAPFDLLVLNPLNTYVVYTNDAYRRKILAVTYISRKDGTKRITAYADDYIYTIEAGELVSSERNIIGIIPIVEFRNNRDRQAAFEPALSVMDAANICNSDRLNDLAQFVQAILWLHNCRISDSQEQKLRDAGFIQTNTTADGKEAKVAYVSASLNQSETQTIADYLDAQILSICGVPGRDSASGGNTGAAILLSNGWQLAETQAKTTEVTFSGSENELLRVILAIIRNTEGMPDGLQTLHPSDVLVKFTRNKTYDLVSRTTALSNLINLGIDPEKAISVVDIFDDSQQVTLDSKDRIDKILFKVGQMAQQAIANTQTTPVDGVKGADDVHAEQGTENDAAQ